MNLRHIAAEAIAEVDAETTALDAAIKCRVPASKCRAAGGPANCRFHCAQYYDLLKEQVSFEEAIHDLKDKYGIECVRRSNAHKVVPNFFLKSVLLPHTRDISVSDFQDSVKSLYVVICDLTTRFPNLKFRPFTYVGLESVIQEEGGMSTDDAIKFGFTVMGFNTKRNYKGLNRIAYGHYDERLPYDIIRHELGHSLMTAKVYVDCERMIDNGISRMGEYKYWKEVSRKISEY